MARYFVFETTVTIAWAIATVVGMTYGIQYDWTDNLHVNYGFPLTFATHTLNTIAGPVDRWSLNLGPLAADLVFWSFGMIVLFALVEYARLPRRRKSLPG